MGSTAQLSCETPKQQSYGCTDSLPRAAEYVRWGQGRTESLPRASSFSWPSTQTWVRKKLRIQWRGSAESASTSAPPCSVPSASQADQLHGKACRLLSSSSLPSALLSLQPAAQFHASDKVSITIFSHLPETLLLLQKWVQKRVPYIE